MNNINFYKNRGFTLVELSIVIVIIGLIVSGLVAGQSLVKQAKISSSISDLQKYKTSVSTFQVSYNALPGDIPNAFDYWGQAAGCTNSAATLANSDGCNGNNNKTIDWDGEEQRFWQHLNLSGLLEGAYTGVKGASTFSAGVDVPEFYGESRGEVIIYAANDGSRKNRLETNGIAADGSTVDIATHMAITAFNIDKKLDDGVANTGQITSNNSLVRHSDNAALTCHDGGGNYIISNEIEPICNIKHSI